MNFLNGKSEMMDDTVKSISWVFRDIAIFHPLILYCVYCSEIGVGDKTAFFKIEVTLITLYVLFAAYNIFRISSVLDNGSMLGKVASYFVPLFLLVLYLVIGMITSHKVLTFLM